MHGRDGVAPFFQRLQGWKFTEPLLEKVEGGSELRGRAGLPQHRLLAVQAEPGFGVTAPNEAQTGVGGQLLGEGWLKVFLVVPRLLS
jgi:hypothetical protein